MSYIDKLMQLLIWNNSCLQKAQLSHQELHEGCGREKYSMV